MKKPTLSLPLGLLGLALVSHLLSSAHAAAEWKEWRGPGRRDHSPDTGLLQEWPAAGPRRLWVSDKAGLGYSGYSVANGRLYTLGLREEQEYLLAFNVADGAEVWATPSGTLYKNDWGNGPRATPTLDGQHVYAMGGKGVLTCADATTGKALWQKDLAKDLGGKIQSWGYTESVLLVGDLVICTPGGEQGTLAALKRDTGEVAWRTKDLTDAAQYASPILIELGGKSQIVQLVMKRFFGVAPDTGAVLWKQDWPGAVAVIPTPIYHDGHVYITSGYKVGCTLVKLGEDNSVTKVYENKTMVNHHGGVVLVGDHLYGYSDGAGWICQNFKTGEQVWASKALGKGAVHFADGQLYCLDENSGEVALVDASPKGWTEHGRFKIDPQTTKRSPQGRIWTHPVVVDGRLFLRDQEYLLCYDVKRK